MFGVRYIEIKAMGSRRGWMDAMYNTLCFAQECRQGTMIQGYHQLLLWFYNMIFSSPSFKILSLALPKEPSPTTFPAK